MQMRFGYRFNFKVRRIIWRNTFVMFICSYFCNRKIVGSSGIIKNIWDIHSKSVCIWMIHYIKINSFLFKVSIRLKQNFYLTFWMNKICLRISMKWTTVSWKLEIALRLTNVSDIVFTNILFHYLKRIWVYNLRNSVTGYNFCKGNYLKQRIFKWIWWDLFILIIILWMVNYIV